MASLARTTGSRSHSGLAALAIHTRGRPHDSISPTWRRTRQDRWIVGYLTPNSFPLENPPEEAFLLSRLRRRGRFRIRRLSRRRTGSRLLGAARRLGWRTRLARSGLHGHRRNGTLAGRRSRRRAW